MNKRALSFCIFCLSLFFLNSACASASEIVPGSSCNGVKIGDTQEAVKVHLGAPTKTEVIGGYDVWTYYLCDGGIIMGIQWNAKRRVQSVNLLALTVPPDDRVLHWVRTTNTFTSKGITFGTPLSEVYAKMGQPARKANSKNGVQLVYPGLLLYANNGVVYYLRVSSNVVGS